MYGQHRCNCVFELLRLQIKMFYLLIFIKNIFMFILPFFKDLFYLLYISTL